MSINAALESVSAAKLQHDGALKSPFVGLCANLFEQRSFCCQRAPSQLVHMRAHPRDALRPITGLAKYAPNLVRPQTARLPQTCARCLCKAKRATTLRYHPIAHQCKHE